MVTISVERVERIAVTELWPLFEQHSDELNTNPALRIVAPDMARYVAAEQAGMFFALIARDEQGVVVGYSANFVAQHLHYSGLRYAHNDLLFLARPYRAGSLGLRLMRETEQEAKARGAQELVWHAKPGTTLDLLLTRRGYRVQDVMYGKQL